jgi:quinolinate synthase
MKIEDTLTRIKEKLGANLLIMAHFYQKDEVAANADIVGDSYKLAVHASQAEARYIVLCGVFFMAESARILAGPEQHVYLPVPEAGCPMADMISSDLYHTHVASLRESMGDSLVPIVYVNSPARVKALVGDHGGSACTSSNAAAVCGHYLARGKKILFLPDANLGINTALALGLARTEIHRYDSAQAALPPPAGARFIVWDGYCHVHTRFTMYDIIKARTHYPYAKILVHPECIPEVTEAADFSGSTSQIAEQVAKAEAGDVIFVGTEYHFVHRLALLRRDISVFPLKKSLCRNMAKTGLSDLSRTLEEIEAGIPDHEILLPPSVSGGARKALQNMIDITTGKDPCP